MCLPLAPDKLVGRLPANTFIFGGNFSPGSGEDGTVKMPGCCIDCSMGGEPGSVGMRFMGTMKSSACAGAVLLRKDHLEEVDENIEEWELVLCSSVGCVT